MRTGARWRRWPVHIGTFGAARLESTPLIEWAKNILMTQQGAAGEMVEMVGRRPRGQRQGRVLGTPYARSARRQLTPRLSANSWQPMVII